MTVLTFLRSQGALKSMTNRLGRDDNGCSAPPTASSARLRAILLGWLVTLGWFAPIAMAQQPIAPTPAGHYAHIAGVRLYYEECGSGASTNLVLLHDGLLHSVTWDNVWGSLCAHYHVLRYDRRGYGRSDPATAPFAPEDDLSFMMRQARMDRAIVVGNSSGAGLALDFSLAYPRMVEGLVLIGPVVHGMPSSAYFSERGARANAPLAQHDTTAVAANWSHDRYLFSGSEPAVRQQFFDALRQNPQNLITGGQYEIRPSPPTVTRLSQIETPTLVIIGDSDIADVIAYAGAIEAALPIVSLEVWRDAGHLIQLQQPRELVERIDRFAAIAGRVEAAQPRTILRGYVGEYQFGDRTIVIVLRGNRLWLRLPDLPEKPLFAASAQRFFVRTTSTEFEFQTDHGRVVQLIIHNADGSTINCPAASPSAAR